MISVTLDDGETIHNAFFDRDFPKRDRGGSDADLDAQGGVVGLDIDGASTKLDLMTLETFALPVKTTRAA